MNLRGSAIRASPVHSTTSSTSASTPSTVIHLSHPNISSTSPEVLTDPDPSSTSTTRPKFKLQSTARIFRSGNDLSKPDSRVLPTSNFLINRHKLLRKTEEGKVLQQGGTLTGAARRLSGSESVLNPIKTEETAEVVIKQPEVASEETRQDDGFVLSEEIENDNLPERLVKSDGLADLRIINLTDDNRRNQADRWSSRPELHVEETNKKVDELIAKQKRGGVLRGSMTRSRSRTPSRGASEERKKKEEHLHETVVYTKVKPEPQPPLNGNRHFLLRGRNPSVTRVQVSSSPPPPQQQQSMVNINSDVQDSPTVVSNLQIRGPRPASPSPQRAVVIPTPIQNQSQARNMLVHRQSTPVEGATTPVYKRLSEARSMVKSAKVENVISRLETSSPANSFIRPNIRPIPPRKPVKTDMTESLLEVLPQQMKRQAPEPPVAHQQPIIIPERMRRSEQDIRIRTNFSPPPSAQNITSLRVNQESHRTADPSYRTEIETPSYGGQMTFDDEYGSVMSSSQVDYDHSSADEHDDLVKRSLVKASNRRLAEIDNIQEENVAVNKSAVEPTVVITRSNLQADYDRLPQRPVRVVRKPSFLSSADESDASRGHHPTTLSTGEMVTRTSRKDHLKLHDDQNSNTDDSAGRRKYNERRLVQRSFEDDLQRKRVLHSSTANSFIDNEIADQEDDTSFSHHHNISDKNDTLQYAYRRPGLTPSRSKYAYRDNSDDGASDSVGIPEPLPEYEYPNRIQGRTIKEVQEIRETVRLRNDSSSSSSPGRTSPSRRPTKQDRHFSRHFDITPDELNTARSLIHHRLPPNYNEPPQPVMIDGPPVRIVGPNNIRNQTPPPTRQFGHFARPPSQSPARVRAGPYLPPQSPIFGGASVHHSDGESMRYMEEKPKKKMGIVRRLSELVRGERKYKGDGQRIKVRNSSTSSMEEPQENLPPQVLAARRQSPIRRYQDTPYRPPGPNTPIPIDRSQNFANRPVQRAASNRYSATFSDSPTGTTNSFMYQEASAAPVYAQPNKLQKQQNLRYRSMSEYDLNRGPPPEVRPDLRYESPMKPSKSIESLSESVWRQTSPGPHAKLGLFEVVDKRNVNRGRYGVVRVMPSREQSSERVFKTKLIPVGKGLKGDRVPDVSNTTYGLYDKKAKQYSSTPVLPSSGSGQVNYQMAPPIKPPRRYDYDSANRSSDSDPPPPRQLYRRRMEDDERSPQTVPPSHSGHYNEPSDNIRRPRQSSTSGGDDTPPRQRFQSNLQQRPLRSTENIPPTSYARTRIAANDYTNRRYHSAAAEINRPPPPLQDDEKRRFVGMGRGGEGVERQYKSSYKLPQAPSGTLVQERTRMFSNNNQPARKEYTLRR